MAEKIIFLTTASLEEDLAEDKKLDAGQIKAIVERYGEDEFVQYVFENNVVFNAIGDTVTKMVLIHGIKSQDTLDKYMSNYQAIKSDGNNITLYSIMDDGTGPGDENEVVCRKVHVGRL